MAARALVDSQIEQGTRLLHALDEVGIRVDVAYWMLSDEWGDWRLVLAAPLLDEDEDLRLRIIDVRRSLDDADLLAGRLGIVGMNHRWVRALKERLPRGLPKPGHWLGGFWARDANLSVEDSYVYRFEPRVKSRTNGTTSRRRVSPGAVHERRTAAGA